jgi:Mannosyltransferase (PIG-V)
VHGSGSLPLSCATVSTLDAYMIDTDTQLAPHAPAALAHRGRAGWLPARLAAVVPSSLDAPHARAVRDSWRALWSSRLLVLVVGVGTVAVSGFGPARKAFGAVSLTHGRGWLGDLLTAPVARWDSAWFLEVARHGYQPQLGGVSAPRDAYFPLYPLAIRALSVLGGGQVLAGGLLSLGAFAVALYGIHRLTTLELGGGQRGAQSARLAVLVMAFSPMAFFFSAVYSESLYLALSVGVFWAARNGRWGWVGVLGALASATRNTGLVLLLAAAVIYLYGPRRDRAPDRPAVGGSILRPRYRMRWDALWLAAMPLGAAVFELYLRLAGGRQLGSLHAEAAWGRHFTGPLVGLWDALRAAFDGARQLLSPQTKHVYFAAAEGSATINAEHNLLMLTILAAAIPATIGVLRRLPLAYGLYVIGAIALPLSDPVRSEPLQSLPRFMVVLFPLGIWLAAWLAERPRTQRPVLLLSASLLAVFLAQFATWHWVA